MVQGTPDEPQPLYRLVVPGEAVPKARPRLDRRHMRIYTPTTTAQAEHDIGWRFRQQYPGVEPDKVARFAVVLTFYCGRGARGDVDNRTKTVLDALNRVVYWDDRQIDELHALVVHGARQPRTEIEIFRKRPEWR